MSAIKFSIRHLDASIWQYGGLNKWEKTMENMMMDYSENKDIFLYISSMYFIQLIFM